MHITSKGQVTIPRYIREKWGFLPNTEIEFYEEQGRVYVEKVAQKSNHYHDLIARMRGTATVKMTTDEIMALTRGGEKNK